MIILVASMLLQMTYFILFLMFSVLFSVFNILFIEHLGHFYVSAIVDSAAKNIAVYVSFPIIIVLIWVYVWEWDFWILWQFYVLFCFVLFCFQETVVFHSASPIYIPTNRVRGFPFLHTLSSIYYLQTF